MGAVKSKLFRSKSGSRKSNRKEPDKPAKERKKQKKVVNLPESQSARKCVDPRLPFSNYRQIFSICNAWKAIQRCIDDCATETFIRFLSTYPVYKDKYTSISGIKDGELEDFRKNLEFEDKAMDIYVIFDGVIENLENVDKALQEIQYGTPTTQFSHRMVKDYYSPFLETIRITLGSDRFTETTEDNFKLLYQFVQEEMCKHIEDDDPVEVIEKVTEESKVVPNTEVEVNQSMVDADTAIEVNQSVVIADTALEVNLCSEDAT